MLLADYDSGPYIIESCLRVLRLLVQGLNPTLTLSPGAYILNPILLRSKQYGLASCAAVVVSDRLDLEYSWTPFKHYHDHAPPINTM